MSLWTCIYEHEHPKRPPYNEIYIYYNILGVVKQNVILMKVLFILLYYTVSVVFTFEPLGLQCATERNNSYKVVEENLKRTFRRQNTISTIPKPWPMQFIKEDFKIILRICFSFFAHSPIRATGGTICTTSKEGYPRKTYLKLCWIWVNGLPMVDKKIFF